jgi:hypothetical protein|tara:strand:+ start:1153 stop:1380 length:228 start_codon:yes stop_codon:yes gene_type:complete
MKPSVQTRLKLIKAVQSTIKWGLISLTTTHGFNIYKYPELKTIIIGMFYSIMAILLWEFSIGVYIDKKIEKLEES